MPFKLGHFYLFTAPRPAQPIHRTR